MSFFDTCRRWWTAGLEKGGHNDFSGGLPPRPAPPTPMHRKSQGMTQAEEIDMLRRAVADLTERVRVLEARPAWPAIAQDTRHPTDPSRVTITPMTGPLYGPAGDPPSTVSPMPQRFPTTCVAQVRSDGSALLHGVG